MGAIWSALKSLGAIAGLLRDLVAWFREIQKKRALDQVDEIHAANSAAIDDAFAERVPDPAAGGPGAAPAAPPAVPGGEGRGP